MKNILLVDDSKSFIDILASVLKQKNTNVVTANDVDEAIDKIQNNNFDLICSDYNMGKKSGLELLNYLRKTQNDVKFIMLTGEDSREIQYRVESYGGIFLDKATPDLVKNIMSQLK